MVNQKAKHTHIGKETSEKRYLIANWKSPSNIALIKYWGKLPGQFPRNASLSFGLSKSVTQMQVKVIFDEVEDMCLDFRFEGQSQPAFAERIQKYLIKLQPSLEYLKTARVIINSRNSFPHSSGIASSASAMGSLALCLMDIAYQQKNKDIDHAFYSRASFLARLGSGSAARSVFPGYVVWGKTTTVDGSSDEQAVGLNDQIHPGFKKLNDAVLITSSGQKAISSSAGHAMMDDHPYARARYQQAENNLMELTQALKAGDEAQFIKLVENEALSLHALMMSSENGFTLLNEHTWKIIAEIRKFRESTGIFVCFTLDAGPNVHLLYKPVDKNAIVQWIEQKLLVFCEANQWIDDAMGMGPVKMN